MADEKFIDIKRLIKSKNPKLLKWLPGFVISYLKRILHQEEINSFLKENKHKKNQEFCDEVMKYFNIKVQVNDIHHIPKEGPVILIMNHPLGGMDGIELQVYGHLLDQFWSPLTNELTGPYGADTLENRLRFPLDVLSAIRKRVGSKFIVGFRYTADEMQKGGITPEEGLLI